MLELMQHGHLLTTLKINRESSVSKDLRLKDRHGHH